MSAERIRLAVFDCDGTLVDSQHAIVEAMSYAFANEGLPAPPAEAVRRVIGLPLLECATRLIPSGAPALWERLSEAYKQAFFAQRQRPDHHEPLFDGVAAALDAIELRAGCWASPRARPGAACWRCSNGMGWRSASSPCNAATWGRASHIPPCLSAPWPRPGRRWPTQ